MNTACDQETRERRDFVALTARLLQQAAGYGHPVLSRPLPQLNGVQMKSFVRSVNRHPSSADPPSERGFVHVQVRGGFSYAELQWGLSSGASANNYGRGEDPLLARLSRPTSEPMAEVDCPCPAVSGPALAAQRRRANRTPHSREALWTG